MRRHPHPLSSASCPQKALKVLKQREQAFSGELSQQPQKLRLLCCGCLSGTFQPLPVSGLPEGQRILTTTRGTGLVAVLLTVQHSVPAFSPHMVELDPRDRAALGSVDSSTHLQRLLDLAS